MAAMREQEASDRRFVFVQPRAEFEAQRPPQNPELSDRDRSIMTPYERTPEPSNPLPYSRGNTPERIDQPGTPEGPRPADRPAESGSDAKEPGSPAPGPPATETREIDDPVIRGLRGPKPQAQAGNNGTGTGGGLSNALRDVTRYVPEQIFNNPQGGGQFGDSHPVRYERCRVRPMGAPVPRPGQAQLVRAVRGHVASRPCVRVVQRAQERIHHGHRRRGDDRHRVVQQLVVQRHRRVQSHAAAPARVPRRPARSSPSRSTTTKRRPHADGDAHPHTANSAGCSCWARWSPGPSPGWLAGYDRRRPRTGRGRNSRPHGQREERPRPGARPPVRRRDRRVRFDGGLSRVRHRHRQDAGRGAGRHPAPLRGHRRPGCRVHRG